ncbi:MAG: hypothetical protein H7Y04_03830 [Verrucomicrobia bacterium]|nr:hypothetical protein [Cytophagales bacterium]
MKTAKFIVLALVAVVAVALVAFVLRKPTPPVAEKKVDLLIEKQASVENENVTAPEIDENNEIPESDTEMLDEEGKPLKIEPAMFRKFVASFPQADLPLVCGQAYMKNLLTDKNEIIAEDFRAFVPELTEHKFSRMSYDAEFQYIAKIYETKDFVAVIYSDRADYVNYMDEENSKDTKSINMGLHVATYSKTTGKRIAVENIAYMGTNAPNFQNTIIKPNGVIASESFENLYKDGAEIGDAQHPVVGKRLTVRTVFTITSNGEIKKQEMESDKTATIQEENVSKS